jgi:sugar (pentulose or hexulose) kinase
MQMKLLGIDIGTTHCKAGLFRTDGTAVRIAKQATQVRRSPAGYAHYDPEALWQSVAANISEVTNSVPAGQIGAIGVTSMAETGLLLDLATEQPRTPLIPWFDTGATAQAERLEATGDPLVAFRRSGIQPNFKCGLAKILWLREALGADLKGARWLGMADYIVYRLTGAWVTDYSLAGRTYAFDIASKQWDDARLASLDVSADIFPEALPATETAGRLIPAVAAELGLAAGTPVSVAGHDHVCAAFVGAALQPGQVFDSMGTAEVLTGALPERPLNRRDFRSGLSYGCHVAPGYPYWMGGLSASGGSLSWLRSVLGDPPLTNDELMALSKEQGDGPGEILYFPYLAGGDSAGLGASLPTSMGAGQHGVWPGPAVVRRSRRARHSPAFPGNVVTVPIGLGQDPAQRRSYQCARSGPDCARRLPGSGWCSRHGRRRQCPRRLHRQQPLVYYRPLCLFPN